MNQTDQNINKDMFDSDLIDVESLDFGDDQTWLCTVPSDSGEKLDIVTWNLNFDWPINEDDEYLHLEKQLTSLLDDIIKNEAVSLPDKHKFDSRTYVRPKKRSTRPSIQNIVEAPSNQSSISPHPSLNPALNHMLHGGNKYLTYNKYNSPLGAMSPLLRLKTFNVDTHTDNSIAVKEYAMKRRSLVQDDDPQLEDVDMTLVSESSGRFSMEPSKPINIDLSQPAHNLHNTFNKGVTNMFDRASLNMYQSGESLMRMSPPSLVSSLLMDSSGTFTECKPQESAPPPPGRDSIDPMVTSMTLSILDEKDMSTSFLSQTTYPDHDSLLDSLPPSLVNSVNSSYVASNKPKEKDDSNIFSSATFTHLEQSEKLLSARPRCQLYNSFTRREPKIKNSESYTKSREEACQIDTVKVLNENTDKKEKESPRTKPNVDMTETITLHYSNNKFTDAEKENFEKDDTFYKEMGIAPPEEPARNSLNVTLGKQELNEIIQARQKISLARRGLPSEPEKLPNQIDSPTTKTIHLPNQIITVPKQSMENASELLSRRRAMNGFERSEDNAKESPKELRDTPKRNATFKVNPRLAGMDTTVVYMKGEETPANDNNIIDINSATINLLNEGEGTLQHEEWGSQARAMVGSSSSTDTGTFSSSSPPDSVPDTTRHDNPRQQIASTPLLSHRKNAQNELLNMHNTISPIYDMVADKSYTVTKVPSNGLPMERTFDMHNTTVVNSATMVKKPSAKRDILAAKTSPDKKILPVQMKPRTSPGATAPHGLMVPPSGLPFKSSLPTSKLRQYSSHRELSRIPGCGPNADSALPTRVSALAGGRTMVRRGVYASNPALSPTSATHPQLYPKDEHVAPARPVLMNPPALVRQGTETLRRASQLQAPKDLRGPGSGVPMPVSMRPQHIHPPSTRPYSIAGTTQLRVTSRPSSVPGPKPTPVPITDQPRPATGSEQRMSALPRPSRLPAPRRGLRPPSVYSVAPSADADQY